MGVRVQYSVYVNSEHCVCTLLSILPQSFPSPRTPWGFHTDSLAVLGQCVHLVARVALTLKVALVIDTDLAAGIRVLTLIDVCGEQQRSELAGGSASAWGHEGRVSPPQVFWSRSR